MECERSKQLTMTLAVFQVKEEIATLDNIAEQLSLHVQYMIE